MSWLGIDLGTSSLKAAVVSDDGRLLGRGRAEYPLRSRGAVVEQDAADYGRALRSALEACRPYLDQVRGIGLVGQTPSLVLVDADGEPVAPVMVWRDARAAAEAAELRERLGARTHEILGLDLPWAPSFPPARLLWLARHQPRLRDRVRWLLQPKDFLGLQLTGSPASDPWSSKGLCHLGDQRAAGEVFDAVGWGAHVVPPILQAWEPRGRVTDTASAAYGLPAGLPVATGWSDALGGMLGVGAFTRPTGFVISGTTDIAGMTLAEPPADVEGLLHVPRSCAPLDILYGPTQSSGGSVRWWSELLAVEPDELVAMAARRAGDGVAMPVFAPYLAGERAPLWNDDVRGALLGMDIGHGREDVARGAVAGIALSARHVLWTATQRSGREPDEIHVGGRDALDPAWRAIRRQTLGRPLVCVGHPDPACLGAAMLGALSAGRSWEQAAALRGDVGRELPSDAERDGADRLLERYLAASASALAFVGAG